jgi:hypothetical protein
MLVVLVVVKLLQVDLQVVLVTLLQQIPHKVILVEADLVKEPFQEFLLVVEVVELQQLVVMLLLLQVELEVRVHQIQLQVLM